MKLFILTNYRLRRSATLWYSVYSVFAVKKVRAKQTDREIEGVDALRMAHQTERVACANQFRASSSKAGPIS